ncbi:MAG TPA: DUF4910 domain-containing protein [Phycisphaerae bacterium]|nr:DUF4910 domain-containing protein [Phycisphaerae bacterium]
MRGELERFWRLLRQHTHGQRTLGFVRRLWETDRWADFAHFHKTADTVAELFEQFGLADVERVEIPADGRHEVGDWVMPLAWDCDEAVIEIADPAMDEAIVARRSDVPNVAGEWCAPTEPGGQVFDCVFLPDGNASALEELDVRGKLVCTTGQSRQIRGVLAEKGAAGCISSWTRNERLADATQWINVASDRPGGWGMTALDSRQITLAVTRRQMARLAELADRHGRLRLRVRVEARLYEGALPFVSARLAGQDPSDQEVILLGHLYEQGANDNATGCASILEIARSLAAAVAAGHLARPRRSIRFLLMGESYGSLAYAIRNFERMQRTIAGLCVDTGAGPPELARCHYQINGTPLCARSFLDAWHVTVAREYVRRYRRDRQVTLTDFALGTDQLFNDPAIGTPTNWVMIPSADDVWHNSADSLETLDVRAHEDLVGIEGATAYSIAGAGAQETALAAELTAAHELARLEGRLHDRLLAGGAGWSDQVGEVIVDAVARSVRSAGQLAGDAAGHVEAAAEAARARAVACLADDRDRRKRLGLADDRADDEADATRWDRQAERMVPRRSPGLVGSLSLDTVPVERWAAGGMSHSPRWGGPCTMAWWWADGRRNVRQIRDAVLAEGASLDGVDLLKYFQFLSDCGHVTI